MESSYTWRITDETLITQMKNAKQNQPFLSPSFRLFNLTFQLQFFPNGQSKTKGNAQLFLMICGLSPKVHSINMSRKYRFVEVDAEYAANCEITKERMYCSSWAVDHVKTTDIQKLNQITLKVDVKLFNVFDIDGKDITNEYLKNVEHKTEPTVSKEDQRLNTAKLDSVIIQIEKLNETVKAMQQQMNDMKLRMEEEKKNSGDDRFDKLEKQVKLITQTVNKLSLNSNINPEKQKLKSWFENKVKLPEYYNLFIENGIEDLTTTSLLTMDSLKAIGVDKIGHQVKLLHQIAALKDMINKNNIFVDNEGPTAYI